MNQQDCQERAASEVVEQNALDAFSTAQRKRLMRLRQQVLSGERSDSYPVDKRQDFVRWLVDHGKLSDN